MELTTPISELTRVGKTTAGRLKLLGIENVRDLLFYFPFRYDDFSLLKSVKDLQPDEAVTVRVKVQLIANRRSWRKRKMLTEALVADETGTLKVVWFNQPYLTKTIKVGDEIFLSGKVNDDRIEMISPDYEKVKAMNVHTARLVPIYHLTSGLTEKQVRFLLSQAMQALSQINEFLPVELLRKQRFLSLKDAIENIHFPKNMKAADQARKRLQFDELFLIQLAIQMARKELGENKAPHVAFLEKQTKDFVASLPFQLTSAQKKSAWEILRDLEKEKPMNRLLEGDVGSGKTMVMALAALNVALNGYKTALLTPTEILAAQHYGTLRKLFNKHKFNIVLFAANKREMNGEPLDKKEALELINNGGFDLIVGTHAVIQDNVTIKDLGLVVIDEQHRFGVNQRKALLRDVPDDVQDSTRLGKWKVPHFLSMTATPIPRSLVLSLYGDLDLSIINELPVGRKPILTRVVYEQQRLQAYDFIRKQVNEGRQVFVVCPLIDPSDKSGMKSVSQEFEKLSQSIFPDLKIGKLHGRLKPTEKQAVMRKFLDKEFDLLVTTSVIEVGVDVPNSTVMMIEGADRFGLAQLHQFRGRVGRGQHQSYCFLFSESAASLSHKRLKYMETCSDGFKLAEKDLELRGPGEVCGVRQSGLPDLKIASLTDVEMIKLAQAEAKEVVEKNKMTNELRETMRRVKVSVHFE